MAPTAVPRRWRLPRQPSYVDSMPEVGFEPTSPQGQSILSRSRMPIPPLRPARNDKAGSGRLRLARGAGAVVLTGADRALLLDVPLLVEGVEGGGDEDDLQQAEDDHQQADERGAEQRFVEAGAVAVEPAFGADRAEDRQDHRKRRHHGEDAAVPARDQEGEEGVEDRVDRADGSHPAATLQQRT